MSTVKSFENEEVARQVLSQTGYLKIDITSALLIVGGGSMKIITSYITHDIFNFFLIFGFNDSKCECICFF